MSTVISSIVQPSTIIHGLKAVTTAGTEVALTTSKVLKSGVTIKALNANTGTIYVGLNPVTSLTGFPLLAGESIFIEIHNASLIYIDASVSGEGVAYIGS